MEDEAMKHRWLHWHEESDRMPDDVLAWMLRGMPDDRLVDLASDHWGFRAKTLGERDVQNELLRRRPVDAVLDALEKHHRISYH